MRRKTREETGREAAGSPPHVRSRFRFFRTAIWRALSTIQKGTASSLEVQNRSNKNGFFKTELAVALVTWNWNVTGDIHLLVSLLEWTISKNIA